MLKDESFDINLTPCGPGSMCALFFALGEADEAIDEEAVKLVLRVPGVELNATTDRGRTSLRGQCFWGRSRNVELLLADPRADTNQADEDEDGDTPLHMAPNQGRDRCLELLLADSASPP